jgi:hypothetical protein
MLEIILEKKFFICKICFHEIKTDGGLSQVDVISKTNVIQ